jgi:5-methyltetrahydrofolate--homocysteine methyltransferase
MDEGMLDSRRRWSRSSTSVAAEPDIARVPVMIDSSKWEVLEAGTEVRAGQGDRQLDQLKEGEEEFLEQARLVPRYGAAVS